MSLDQVIHISNARLSFPHIAEPQKKPKEDGTERVSYSAEFILTPNDPAWTKFHQTVNAMALEKWKEKAGPALQMIQADRKKRCFGWGQEKVNQKSFKVYDGYDGNVFITAGRDKMPQIIDAQGNAVDPANTMAVQAIARKMYGGCRVNAAIKPWLQENKHGLGIRCDLVAVQFFADDAPFGEGAIDASGLFGAAPTAEAPAGAPAWTPPGAAPAPAWAPPQVSGMPPAPFPSAAPGLPSFLS